MRDLMELYLLGALAPEETAAFERAIRDDAALAADVAELRRVADGIALAAPEAEPPNNLGQRLMARVSLTVVRADHAHWVPTGVPGVEVCVLHQDEASDRQTVLVRMDAGASYPCHRHTGAEECYVVSGDLIDGDLRMTTGDYSRLDAGTEHGPLGSDSGCLLLVTSSLHDEIVE